MAGLADEVEVARLSVRVLKAETPLAEIHLPCDAGVDHPLQRAVDRGPADAMIVAPDEIDKVVRAQVAFLAQEDVDDLFPFARTFTPKGFETREIGQGGRHAMSDEVAGQEWLLTCKVSNAEGRTTSARRHGVRILDREATARHRINEVNLGALEVADADLIDEQPDAV